MCDGRRERDQLRYLGYFVYVFMIFLMGILFLIWIFIMGVLSDSLFLFVLFKYGFGDKFENNIKVVKP